MKPDAYAYAYMGLMPEWSTWMQPAAQVDGLPCPGIPDRGCKRGPRGRAGFFTVGAC